MNRKRTRELLPIMQAFAEGKEVQTRYPQSVRPGDTWFDTPDPDFAINEMGIDLEYRIKPEPFECWVNVYENATCAWPTLKVARNNVGDQGRTIHMREVES